MTTRSGKADRSTVRLSALSAISSPCSDLTTMILRQSSAGLARAHLQPRPFSTAGHDLDHEHNLLSELSGTNPLRSTPHRSFSGPSMQCHEGGDRQETYTGHEAGQYHQREHPCDGTLVDYVDVVYRRFLSTCGHEVDRAKERQSRDGDEQVVTSHVASSGGQVDSGQDEDVDQQAERERRNLRLERPSRMVAPCNVLHMVQYAEDRRRCRDHE